MRTRGRDRKFQYTGRQCLRRKTDDYFNPDDPDDLKWERDWTRLFRLALKDFEEGVPPLATYTSEKGTVVVMRAAITGIPGDPNPVGIYLNGEERKPQGGFLDFHDPDLTKLGFTKEQYKKLPLAERARLNAQIQVEVYGCGRALNADAKPKARGKKR